MPRAEVDGLEFLARMGRGPAAQIPVVILSALGGTLAGHVSAEIRAGLKIAAVLAKPVALETLVQEIGRAVGIDVSP
jgi:hypothetical protein